MMRVLYYKTIELVRIIEVLRYCCQTINKMFVL